MAIIGGAGNPVGGSFTGPAQALEIIGNHAYAYSGKFGASQTIQTALQFTSGPSYLVGTINFNGYVDDDDPGSRNAGNCQVSLNGQGIILMNTGTTAVDAPTEASSKILIPPYTIVLVEIESDANAADQYATVSIIGRIYRD